MLRLQRTLSYDGAWANAIAEAEAEDATETVATAFAVIGLPHGTVLEPLAGAGVSSDEVVIADVRLVGKGETCPPNLVLISETPDGQRASINGLFLAVLLVPRSQTVRPVTAIALVDVDRGEAVAADFEAVDRTIGGERASLGAATLCISRRAPEVHTSTPSAAPLANLCVLRADKGRAPSVPAGFEVVGRALSTGTLGGSARHIAIRRAPPSGLLQTAIKPTLLDSVEKSAAGRRVAAERVESGHTSGAARPSALPLALPHFCLPRGANLRTDCPWPTAHDFALTDHRGARLYGCRCLRYG